MRQATALPVHVLYLIEALEAKGSLVDLFQLGYVVFGSDSWHIDLLLDVSVARESSIYYTMLATKPYIPVARRIFTFSFLHARVETVHICYVSMLRLPPIWVEPSSVHTYYESCSDDFGHSCRPPLVGFYLTPTRVRESNDAVFVSASELGIDNRV
jgi:hypothetical protein